MRRVLAIALAFLIGLPAISPLFALGAAEDASRPACCRRNGKHHCMLVDMDAGASSSKASTSARTDARFTGASISERCPYGSKTLPGGTHPELSLQSASVVFVGIASHRRVAAQTKSQRHGASDRSRPKRGPPARALA